MNSANENELFKSVSILAGSIRVGLKETQFLLRAAGNKWNRKDYLAAAAKANVSIRQYALGICNNLFSNCTKAVEEVLVNVNEARLLDPLIRRQISAEAELIRKSLAAASNYVSGPKGEVRYDQRSATCLAREWNPTNELNVDESCGYYFFDSPQVVDTSRFFSKLVADHFVQLERLLLILAPSLVDAGQMTPAQQRNWWLYELAMRGVGWKKMIVELRNRCRTDKPEWDEIGSVSGIKAAAEKHQLDNPRLPEIPERKAGRRKGLDQDEQRETNCDE